jgi:hypothetical protein
VGVVGVQELGMAKLRQEVSRDLQAEAAKRDLMFKVRPACPPRSH